MWSSSVIWNTDRDGFFFLYVFGGPIKYIIINFCFVSYKKYKGTGTQINRFQDFQSDQNRYPDLYYYCYCDPNLQCDRDVY